MKRQRVVALLISLPICLSFPGFVEAVGLRHKRQLMCPPSLVATPIPLDSNCQFTTTVFNEGRSIKIPLPVVSKSSCGYIDMHAWLVLDLAIARLNYM